MTEAAEAQPAKATAARRPMRARTNRGRSIREEGVIEADKPKQGLRRRGNSRSHDPFYIPEDMIPRGMSVEWKRLTVHGKAVSQTNSEEEDPSYMIDMEEQGWSPATTDQFPRMVGKNSTAKAIVRKGMILMIRPKEYTEEARAEDKMAARTQVRQGLAKLTKGEKKNELDREITHLKRGYVRPPAEDDEEA